MTTFIKIIGYLSLILAEMAISQTSENQRHPLVIKAFQQEQEFREEVQDQIKVCLEESTHCSLSLEEIHQKIEQDLVVVEKLSLTIQNSIDTLSRPIKTHKLKELIEGARDLLKESTNLRIPGYGITQMTPTHLGNNEQTIFGSSKHPIFLTALFYLIQPKSLEWFDLSALYHIESFEFQMEFTFHQKGHLIFPHSKYLLGGHRWNSRYQDDKKFGPEDCSSWLGKLCNLSPLWTVDLLYGYRLLSNEEEIPNDWNDLWDFKNNFYAITINDAQPGDIWFKRRFNLEQDPSCQGKGVSGHSALVVFVDKTHFQTVGVSRSMPLIDGFGIETHPTEPTQNSRYYFLRLRKYTDFN